MPDHPGAERRPNHEPTHPEAEPTQPEAELLQGPDRQDGTSNGFISYSHLDRGFAVRLRDQMVARGKTVWLDESEIRGGTRWSDELQRAIQMSDAFLFLLSPHSAGSRECGKELAYALSLNKRILPLRVAETPIEKLPPGLADYQFIPGRQLFAEAFDHSLAQLITEIETDREWVREHTDWSEKAVEWERHQRDRSYLVSGAELEQAEGWRSRAARQRPGLSTLQSEFIDASRQWTTRRLRRTRGLVSVALAVAIALSVVAFILRQQAVSAKLVANSGELSAQSLLQLGTDPQLSLLLAAQAADVRETPPALDALRRALPQNHLLRTLQRSTAPLNGAQWSADGTLVLTAGEDGFARVWSAATGAVIRRFPLSTYYTQGAMLAARSGEVLTWGGNGVHVWTLAGAAAPVTISDSSFVKLQDAAISPDGRRVATAAIGGYGADLLWDARTGQLVRRLLRPNGPDGSAALSTTLAFSPDGRRLAAGSEDGRATIWDTGTGRVLRRLGAASPAAPTPDVSVVAFSPDGTRLLSTEKSTSGSLQRSAIWNLATGTRIATVPGADASWSPGGGYIATTRADGTAYVYRADTGRTVVQLKGSVPIVGPSVFAPDAGGQLTDILTGSASGQATVWGGLTGSSLETLSGDAGSVVPAGFSPDGASVLTYSSDGAARIWDSGRIGARAASKPRALDTLNPLDLVLPEYYVSPDPLSPLRAYSTYRPQPGQLPGLHGLRVYDVRTGAEVAALPAGVDTYDYAAFDRAGAVMVVMSSGPSGSVRPAQIRRARGGALLHVLAGPGGLARGAAVSPDGRLVAAVDTHNDVGVWSVASGRELAVFRRHRTTIKLYDGGLVDLKFSPDGTLVLSADQQGRAFVWRARSGQVLGAIQGTPVPAGMYRGMGGAISPNDRLVVVTSSWDNDAHVYRVGQPSELTALRGHALGIEDATFNPDSTLIATTSADSTARVWDTQHQSPLLTLPEPTAGERIDFSADGRSLITDSANPYATLPCIVCGGFPRLLMLARQRETRGFTAEERSLYLTG